MVAMLRASLASTAMHSYNPGRSKFRAHLEEPLVLHRALLGGKGQYLRVVARASQINIFE